MKTLVLATRNVGKVEEMRALLAGLPVAVVPASGIFGAPTVEEDAPTLHGNACKKAMALFHHCEEWTLADDTGLMVPALGGNPGVHSARYAGPGCTPQDNRQKLLRMLSGESDRTAYFKTVIALVTDGITLFFQGVCHGQITRKERGTGGFGYDAVFMPAGSQQTFAELSQAEKNAISHRGKALRACHAYLQERLGR